MHLLYNCILFSIYSTLYWHLHPRKQLIMDSWKWWQATYIEKQKCFFILICLKQIIWQVLCDGRLILLLFTWKMDKNFVKPAFVSCSSWTKFWLSEADISTVCPYFEFVWTYFSKVLVCWWRRTIYPKIVAALIFDTPSEISISKPIDSSRGYLYT